jgi:plasmid stabilization system protein ParE
VDYAVIWDDEAIEELGQIVRHIAKDNPVAARKMGDGIFEKTRTLGSFPSCGKVFRKLHRDDVREIPAPPYGSSITSNIPNMLSGF